MRTLEDLKADKKARDQERRDAADKMYPNRGMNNSGYTDVDGNFITLEEAPGGLQTGQTGVADSGNVTLYNTKTNKHHTVLKGNGLESDSKDFIANHNKGLRDGLIVNNRPAPSIHELKMRDENIERRHHESKNRTTGGPLLDSDNF